MRSLLPNKFVPLRQKSKLHFALRTPLQWTIPSTTRQVLALCFHCFHYLTSKPKETKSESQCYCSSTSSLFWSSYCGKCTPWRGDEGVFLHFHSWQQWGVFLSFVLEQKWVEADTNAALSLTSAAEDEEKSRIQESPLVMVKTAWSFKISNLSFPSSRLQKTLGFHCPRCICLQVYCILLPLETFTLYVK